MPWVRGTIGKYDVHITHELATKKACPTGTTFPIKRRSQTCDGRGRRGNDLPLFELAGLKVAMGNAD